VQENSKKIKGINVPIRTYRYNGFIPTEPPSYLSEATEFEKRYMHKFNLFMDFAKSIVTSFMTAKGMNENSIEAITSDPQNLLNEFRKLEYDIQRIYDNNLKTYEAINRKGELYLFQRVEIEKKTKDIENYTENLLNNLPNILYRMIISLNPRNRFNVISYNADNKIFDIIPAEFRNHFLGSKIILDQDSSRQILIIFGKKNYLEKIGSELVENASTHKVAYITKIQEKDLENAYTISVTNPEKLEESMISFLIDATQFFHNSSENDS
jgi:hypothetical protein